MAIDAAQLRVVVSADTSKAEGELKSFSGSMKSMAGSMGAVGGVLAATVSAPLIGIGVSAIKSAASFEKSMNVLQYVTDGSAATMQAMSDQALQLGADTVFSANEAAEGMVELAKAGMDAEDVMDSIAGVMDLAAAGQISVAEAASLSAATLATFSLEATESTRVADVLAAAANASSADISDLAYGVKNAGAVFAANGQEVETLATMIAILADNGISASDAGTQLKTMTLRLTAPTAIAAKEMKKLGLNVFDAEGNMRDYHDILEDMETATKDMSMAQKDAAFQVLFGQDAISAANIFMKEGIGIYEETNAQVKENGAAAAMAAAQNSGLAGALEQIAGSVDSLMTKLALPFLETLGGWIGQLATFVNSLGELPQPVINATLAFAGFAAAIGLVLVAAAGITGIIAALATPIGLATLAVVALAAAVALLWTAWELNWGNIQGKTAEALAVIQPLIDAFAASMTSIGTSLTEIGTKFGTAFEDAELPTFDELFADLLAGDFGGLTSKLQAALDRLVLNLKIQFQIDQKMGDFEAQLSKQTHAAAVAAGALPERFASEMTTAIEGHDWEGDGRATGMSIAAALGAGIKAGEAIQRFTDEQGPKLQKGIIDTDAFMNQLVAEVQSGFSAERAGAAFQGLGAAAGQAFNEFGAGLMSVIGPQLSAISVQMGAALAAEATTIGAQFSALGTTIGTTISTALTTLGTTLSTASTTLGATLTTMAATISTTFTSIGTAISDGIASLEATVTGAIAGMFGGGEAAAGGGLFMPTMPQVQVQENKVDWGEMPTFTWPPLPTWTWPPLTELLGWFWPPATPLTTWKFPYPDHLYGWGWPAMSMPGWVGTLISALGGASSGAGGGGSGGGTGGFGGKAMGTPYWQGGTTWVGEHGPELVNLPQGSQIYSNSDSMAMASGVTIVIENVNVNNGMDIEVLANQLARRFQQKMRS
jgi:TP901 family phage tail tape measure protein